MIERNDGVIKTGAPVHRGFFSLEMMAILAVIAIGIVLALRNVSSMFNKSTLNDEIANVQALMTQARGMLQTQGEYPFSSADKMTGPGAVWRCAGGNDH